MTAEQSRRPTRALSSRNHTECSHAQVAVRSMSAKYCYVHGRNGPDEIAERIVRRKLAYTHTGRASGEAEQATHACSDGEGPQPIVRSENTCSFVRMCINARFHRESTHRSGGFRCRAQPVHQSQLDYALGTRLRALRFAKNTFRVGYPFARGLDNGTNYARIAKILSTETPRFWRFGFRKMCLHDKVCCSLSPCSEGCCVSPRMY